VAASVVPVDLTPFLAAGELLYGGALVAERLADLGPFLETHPDSVHPVTRSVLATGAGWTAIELFRDKHRLRELADRAAAVFAEVDALFLPTVPTTFTIAELLAEPVRHNTTLGRYTQFVNVLDLAAVAVPAGSTVDGRPVGVSLVGPAGSDATLAAFGAALTGSPLESTVEEHGLVVAVVGLHLRGEARHHELVERGARFHGAHRTAPLYRLYHLPGGAPGLVRVGSGGAAIEVELWWLPADAVGGLLAGVGAPLTLGRVRLNDGSEPAGFLCEAYAVDAARDITHFGGWRAYQAVRAKEAPW
jgi:allophanate hydrolase